VIDLVYVYGSSGIDIYRFDCDPGIPDSSTCAIKRIWTSFSSWTSDWDILQVLPRTSSADDFKILLKTIDANAFVLIRLDSSGFSSGIRFYAS